MTRTIRTREHTVQLQSTGEFSVLDADGHPLSHVTISFPVDAVNETDVINAVHRQYDSATADVLLHRLFAEAERLTIADAIQRMQSAVSSD